jgi:hypothetical protein
MDEYRALVHSTSNNEESRTMYITFLEILLSVSLTSHTIARRCTP